MIDGRLSLWTQRQGGALQCGELCSQSPGLSVLGQPGPLTECSGAMAAPPQLQALLQAVNKLLRQRRYHAALAVIKGFRNGAV